MALTKEQILSADDLPRTRVEVPEWAPPGTTPEDAFVFVRTFSGSDREWYDNWFLSHAVDGELPRGEKVSNVAAMLCSLTLCDEAGNKLFTPADIEALGAKNGAALERCFKVALSQNRLSKKSVEDAEKNS